MTQRTRATLGLLLMTSLPWAVSAQDPAQTPRNGLTPGVVYGTRSIPYGSNDLYIRRMTVVDGVEVYAREVRVEQDGETFRVDAEGDVSLQSPTRLVRADRVRLIHGGDASRLEAEGHVVVTMTLPDGTVTTMTTGRMTMEPVR